MVEGISKSEKSLIYKEMVGKDPDALYILSGKVRKRINRKGKKVGIDTATSYADSDASGTLGGKARAFAAAELASVFPDIPIYTNSQSPGHISWEVMQRELEGHGVEGQRIRNGKDPTTTIGELIQLVELSQVNGWSRVAVITSDYHIERASLMFEHMEELRHLWGDKPDFERDLAEFRSRNVDVRFVPAEPILETRSPKYVALIAGVRNTPEYQHRLLSEARGVAILRDKPSSYGLQQ